MLNKVTLQGRLTRDPELRYTSSQKAVCSFGLAVERDRKNEQTGMREADFLDCTAWGKTGEVVARYFTKGRMILLDGRIVVRDWKDKDGNKRRSTEIMAEEIHFCGDKPKEDKGFSGMEESYDGGLPWSD